MEKFIITLYSLYSALASRGLLSTVQMSAIAVLDMMVDFQKGITANVFLDPRTKLPPSKTRDCANYHQPVRSIPFRKLFSKIRYPEEAQFLDIGAGTGKAMLLALELGFKNVRGIELVPELVDYGNSNFRKNADRFKDITWSLEIGDASKIEFGNSDLVIFLNDPFDDPVFLEFLNRLDSARKRSPGKKMLLIYKNNNKRRIGSFEKWKEGKETSEYDFYGNYFLVVSL